MCISPTIIKYAGVFTNYKSVIMWIKAVNKIKSKCGLFGCSKKK